ncbi:MAG: hypothetical protein JJV96_01315 [Alphaproteobacteria bacterium]|nr:hypothetical protein [Alphaproteobacteria bacterium]
MFKTAKFILLIIIIFPRLLLSNYSSIETYHIGYNQPLFVKDLDNRLYNSNTIGNLLVYNLTMQAIESGKLDPSSTLKYGTLNNRGKTMCVNDGTELSIEQSIAVMMQYNDIESRILLLDILYSKTKLETNLKSLLSEIREDTFEPGINIKNDIIQNKVSLRVGSFNNLVKRSLRKDENFITLLARNREYDFILKKSCSGSRLYNHYNTTLGKSTKRKVLGSLFITGNLSSRDRPSDLQKSAGYIFVSEKSGLLTFSSVIGSDARNSHGVRIYNSKEYGLSLLGWIQDGFRDKIILNSNDVVGKVKVYAGLRNSVNVSIKDSIYGLEPTNLYNVHFFKKQSMSRSLKGLLGSKGLSSIYKFEVKDPSVSLVVKSPIPAPIEVDEVGGKLLVMYDIEEPREYKVYATHHIEKHKGFYLLLLNIKTILHRLLFFL